MNEDIAIMITKIFFINIFTYLISLKISKNQKRTGNIITTTIVASIIGTIIHWILDRKINHMIIVMVDYFIQLFFLKIMIKQEGQSLIITNLISNAIVYIMFTISSIVEAIFREIFTIPGDYFNLLLIIVLEIAMLSKFFTLKKINKGISFLQSRKNSDFLDILMINISVIILFAYCFIGTSVEDIKKQILITFGILAIIMGIMIHKTLTLYYKQKLLEKNITDYKNDISERDAKIKKLSDEKFEISKLNHEFYNRQKSLELKVKEFVNNANLNTEIASELNVMEQINNLSKEYSSKHEKIKNPSKLPLTEITEIDDMFKYMQNECKENNINFELQINGNIHHMVNNIIEQSKLVTLIGDHIRDSIIAVKSSNNSYRSIIAILGIKDNTYEFCVHDTGIEFGIETLLKLGVEPITTHKDEGGTGIGFITTFETLKETNSSLIIEEKHEIADNDYTKAVIIRFDGKHEYKIRSYRAKEINKKIKDREIIVENI